MTGAEVFFSRSIMLYGEEGFRRLQRSFVAVVGLGGVGSYAAEALVRAGVGRLRVVDCDCVKPSDVNRQLQALATNVDERKVDAAAKRLRAINPHLLLDARHAFFHSDTASELITGEIDFVVDAIDSLNPKAELIKFCCENGTRIISAMGAAGRMDIGRVGIATLGVTRNCSLARALRRSLRRRGVTADIPVVYSWELPVQPDDGFPDIPVESSGTCLRGRHRRSLPSISTIPAVFGIMAAHFVILGLIGEGHMGDFEKSSG